MKTLKRYLPIFILATSLLTILQLNQIPQVFYWSTGQAKIDFAKESGNYELDAKKALFEGESVDVPALALEVKSPVLGETSAQKRIDIDLTHQKLYAYEGENRIFDFFVSTGKPWWATPTGEFKIWIKLRYVRMEGGSKPLGTYYNLPNVPYTMFIYNDNIPKWKGYGIHGAYWHNNFGKPMSHGCINMRIEEAGKLYNWVSSSFEEVKINIYGETPRS